MTVGVISSLDQGYDECIEKQPRSVEILVTLDVGEKSVEFHVRTFNKANSQDVGPRAPMCSPIF